MNDYSEVYFAIASISTMVIAGLLLLVFVYVLAILYDVKKLSKIARREAEIISKGFEKGAGLFGSELSAETVGFVRALFAILLSYFAPKSPKPKRKTPSKIKEV